jgi:4-diphosphocytidyl-2-C-methyl-D-erythritol kinase
VSGRTARVVAQAKVNLFLRVLAREEGGHHQLETLFCRLAFGDEVVVRVASRGIALDCAGAPVVPVERNLAYRAAVAYRERTGWPTGVAIEIEKRIPVGGGLGGGSADAGAVLRALDALNPEPIGHQALREAAAPLGADVPFLTSEAVLALGWGRGERMLALPPLPSRRVVLVVPPFPVDTADAYRWLAEARAGGTAPVLPRLYTTADLASWRAVAGLAENAFEAPVEARHPRLDELRAALRRELGAEIARLSGSGSTVFGVLPEGSGDRALTSATDCLVFTTETAGRVAAVELSE